MEPLLITAREGQALAGLSNGTWYKLVAEGRIPRLRIGRAVRYRVADVRQFIDALAAEAGAELNGATDG